MPQTFGQAKKALARYASAYDLADIGAAINTAVDELSSSSNWQRLRKIRRFLVYTSYFPIPQDCEAVLRAAVNGTPIDLHGMDYEFLNSGSGDMDYVQAGYAPINGIQDLGFSPTMYDITNEDGVKLCAFGADSLTGESIKVVGVKANGDVVTETIAFTTWSESTGIDGVNLSTVTAAVASQSLMCDVTRIVLPEGASSYISLYALADGEFTFLSRMHPSIRVPEFRRYRIPGFTDTEDAYYRVLAEVKIRPLPLVSDSDVMPFDSLLPVQYMLQSMCSMNSGEVKTADDYRQRAIMALASRENTQQERQGIVVLNTQYDGSIGQASVETYQNI